MKSSWLNFWISAWVLRPWLLAVVCFDWLMERVRGPRRI
jgi:hypothetical protein